MDDDTFSCEECGATCFEEELPDGASCEDCYYANCCEVCSAELSSVEEEMRGLCDNCYREREAIR